MKMSIVIGLVFFCLFFEAEVHSQQSTPDSLANEYTDSDRHNILPEIDKLLVDETISKAGYEFVELFFAGWTWPDITDQSFLIVITERPFRGLSTQVIISVNELIVFNSFLQTRSDFIENLAGIAIEQTESYLTNYQNIIKQLEGDDTLGSGIF